MVIQLLTKFQDIDLQTYEGQEEGVVLAYNKMPDEIHESMRSILFIAGYSLSRSYRADNNGLPRNNPWSKIKHVVFNSNIIRQIACSHYKIEESSVIHMVGGACADDNCMEPFESGKKIDVKNLQFVAIAKWWKERSAYKRRRQTIKFFKKFIRRKYPGSHLHLLGNNIPGTTTEGGITYYRKTFHKSIVPDIYKQSHIQLMFSAFESGPMTLNESMHYRVPFVCANNCCGAEYNNLIDGVCGISSRIDKAINNNRGVVLHRPMTNKSFYDKELRYGRLMSAVRKIVSNYDKYTKWKWTPEFNYRAQSDKWMHVLFG